MTELIYFLYSMFRLFWTIIIHKYYIIVWGIRLNVPLWQLILHDCSKFCPIEFFGYLNKENKQSNIYKNAWLHHQNHNKHHYQYWILREDGKSIPLPMPMNYVREMVCDWIAANKAYSSSSKLFDETYFELNIANIVAQTHSDTLKLIVHILSIELPTKGYNVDEKIISLFQVETNN